ncbi:MAG: glycine cleavage system protein H [Candidatus Methylomirabilia bacterium]
MARIDGYDFPDDLWYDPKEHLWIRPAEAEDSWLLTVGVDAIGQEALGELVYVQLMEAGRVVGRGDAVGALEAEKMVRPVLAPVSGTLAEVNEAVLAAPRLLNQDPYRQGWLLRVRARDWEAERGDLLHGGETVGAWIRAEIKAYNERR